MLQPKSSVLAGLLFGTVLSCFAARTAIAAQYFLNADTGTDSNPGTEANPWKTVERANQQALRPGDYVKLARGTSYVGMLRIAQSGTAAAPITLGAYGPGPAPRLSNLRLRLPRFPTADFFPLGTVFWTFNGEGTDEFIVSGSVFYLDGLQRLYKSEEHKLGIEPVCRHKNLYFSPNGDIPRMLGQALKADERVARPVFVDLTNADYRLQPSPPIAAAADPEQVTYHGAYPPGKPTWKAGLTPFSISH